jgi:hypothetical protein
MAKKRGEVAMAQIRYDSLLCVTMTPDLRAAIIEAAALENVTLAEYGRTALRHALRVSGVKIPKTNPNRYPPRRPHPGKSAFEAIPAAA